MPARTIAIINRYARLAMSVFLLCCASRERSFASPPAEHQEPSRLQSIESAIQAASFSTSATRVVVRGIVTSSRHGIVIEDRTGAVEVKPVGTAQISLGDEVEVTGQLTLDPNPKFSRQRCAGCGAAQCPFPCL